MAEARPRDEAPGQVDAANGQTAGRAPGGLQIHKTFSALAYPAYRLLWLSMLCGFMGMQMQQTARGVLAYEIGGTNSALAVISVAWGVPMLVFSLVGGALADRIERRMLLVFAQAGGAVMATVTAVMVSAGVMTIPYLFILGVFSGLIFALSAPARQAVLPEVIPESQLLNGIALNSSGMNLSRIVGPSLAGPMIAVAWIDIQGVFFIQAALNIVSLVLLLLLPLFKPKTETEGGPPTAAASRARRLAARGGSDGPRGSMWQEMVNGLRYVAASPILAMLLIMGLVPTMLGMPYQTFLPVFAKDVFGDGIHRNAGALGFMMTMTGVGALIGSLCVASMQDFPRRAQLQLFGGLSFGLSLAFFAVQTNFVLCVIGLTLVGFSANFFQALNSSMIMSASDPRFYGRVMSVNMLTFALMPLGTLPIGFLADAIGSVDFGSLSLLGVQTTLMGAGLCMVAFILLMTVKNPTYRKLEQSDLKGYAAEAAERMGEAEEGGSVWGQLRTARDQRRGGLAEGDPATE